MKFCYVKIERTSYLERYRREHYHSIVDLD
jgi:hypothetical protein